MQTYYRLWIVLVAAFMVATCPGCPNGDDSNSQTDSDPAAEEDPNGGDPSIAVQPEPLQPPPPPTIPEVVLTDKDRAACLVWIGDTLPDGELPDFDGKLNKLADLCGQRATVVCFWTSGTTQHGPLRAVGLLEDLGNDCAGQYADKGLQVVGINVSDAVEVARQQIQEAGVKFSALLDPGGEYFAKIATEKLPRIYVLDAQRKIRWLDIEYSEITRENLQRTIEVVLGEN